MFSLSTEKGLDLPVVPIHPSSEAYSKIVLNVLQFKIINAGR
jgi:hypothetical protein